MTNLYRRNDRGSFLKIAAAFAVLAGLVFVFDYATDGLARTAVRAVGAGVGVAYDSVRGSVFESDLLASRVALQDENRALRADLQLQAEKVALYEFLKDENEQLRGMARLAEAEDGVTVPIASSFDSSPYGTFLIGSGESGGVREGAMVLTPGGFVLGSVASADRYSAVVESFFAPGREVPVRARDETFSAHGRGSGNARASVPRETRLSVGDVVVAPEFGSRPVGVIGRIESATSSATATLYIRVPVNVDALSYVYVVPVR